MRLMFTLLLGCLASTGAFAQNYNGKKMLTLGLGFQGTSVTTGSDNPLSLPDDQKRKTTAISTEILYGKVSTRGVLFAYGLLYQFNQTSISSGTGPETKDRDRELYPQVMVQKFMPVTAGVYFAPAAKFRVRYDRDQEQYFKYNLYQAGLAINPLSFAVGLKPRTTALFTLGELNLNFAHTRIRSSDPLQTYASQSTGISLAGTFQHVQVAVQFIL